MPTLTIKPLQPVKKMHIQPNDKPIKAPMNYGWVAAVAAALEKPKDKPKQQKMSTRGRDY